MTIAIALEGKRLLAQWFQQAGVSVGSDPNTIWSLALVIAAGTLAWGLPVFQRRPSQVADLVVQFGRGYRARAARRTRGLSR
ncbi:MAG: hypothetical protein LH650_10580 [Chloroflexi bacterium]|nr:hypothetical protein [Chloroflexota bacterium]